MVVDEAHRAVGDYSYCGVINVRGARTSPVLPSPFIPVFPSFSSLQSIRQKNKRFRVLALSATPGENLEQVQNVINSLMITHIEIRSEEAMDVRRYMNERKVWDKGRSRRESRFAHSSSPPLDRLTPLWCRRRTSSSICRASSLT